MITRLRGEDRGAASIRQMRENFAAQSRPIVRPRVYRNAGSLNCVSAAPDNGTALAVLDWPSFHERLESTRNPARPVWLSRILPNGAHVRRPVRSSGVVRSSDFRCEARACLRGQRDETARGIARCRAKGGRRAATKGARHRAAFTTELVR